MAKLSCLRDRLGEHPSKRLRKLDPAACMSVSAGIRHRFVGPGQIASLLWGISRMLREQGRLKPSFLRGYSREGNVVDGLETLVADLWPVNDPAGLPGPGFLLAAVRGGSPLKRLNLFLRWMVRDDEIDLGLWEEVPPSNLLIPLDVHVFRIARFLGLLPFTRSGPRLRDAVALTDALRRIDPVDPVRFDFALSHLGISGECRGRHDDIACPPCPLSAVCRPGGRPDQ